jgi:hypothetical protein
MFSLSKLKVLRRILCKKEIVNKDLDLLVCSFGGVGTSFFIKYISQYKIVNHVSNEDGLKHLAHPPIAKNKNLKVIYIVGNPYNAVISIFRRNHQYTHSKNLLKYCPNVEPIAKGTNLEEYLDRKVKKLKIRKHILNWINVKDNTYPIMVIKYEYLWEYIDEILYYLDIPLSEKKKFPKREARKSDIFNLDKCTQTKLVSMYKDAFVIYNNIKPIFIIQPNKSFRSYFSTRTLLKIEEKLKDIVST